MLINTGVLVLNAVETAEFDEATMSVQAAQQQSEDAAASGRLRAERDAQIERLREELTGYKEERDLEMEALTEERDRLDAALAVRPGLESGFGVRFSA